MPPNAPIAGHTAILLGASGSVGSALLHALLREPACIAVISLSRRPVPGGAAMAASAGCALHEHLVPEMTPTALEAATIEALGDVRTAAIGFSALGIGAGTAAMSLDAHRAVDVELNAAFARGLRASGKVQHLAYMSAVGADPNAKVTGSGAAGMPRYNRVKGESEVAVRAQGPNVVSIFRPSVILGSPHTPRLLETLMPLVAFATPARFRPMTVQQIANAMVITAQAQPTQSAVYHVPEMMRAISVGERR